jgi:hypothetical protein
MKLPRIAPPARLFFGVFTGFPELLDWARDRLGETLGALDEPRESPEFPFPETDTYAESMGSGLRRKFFVRREPIAQDALAAIKWRAVELEAEAAELRTWPVTRPINIDPGIVNDCRVILATTKDYAHRLYRGDGIWEEVTLVYRGGRFETMPWTYPDFQSDAYREYFAGLRREHLDDLRHGQL